METTHYTTRSSYTRCLHTVLRPFKPRLVSSGRTQPGGSQRLTPHRFARRHCNIEERQTGSGLWVYNLRTKTLTADDGDDGGGGGGLVQRRIYYFAGGGWQQPPSSQHWKFCTALCRALGPDTVVAVVSHPLAPHTPAVQAMPVLRTFYEDVMAEANTSAAAQDGHRPRIVLAGDSSGGNIALCLTLYALNDPQQQSSQSSKVLATPTKTSAASISAAPDALLLISPAVDLRLMQRQDAYAKTERHDPVLTIDSHNSEIAQWTAGVDAGEPWLSPVTADMSVLTREHVHVLAVTGGFDILTPDALELRKKCEEAGVAGHWLHWEQQMHCFPLAYMYGLSESVRAKDWIVDRLRAV